MSVLRTVLLTVESVLLTVESQTLAHLFLATPRHSGGYLGSPFGVSPSEGSRCTPPRCTQSTGTLAPARLAAAGGGAAGSGRPRCPARQLSFCCDSPTESPASSRERL